MLSIIAVCLAAASLVLHVVAPKTKTKVDDKIRDGVDFAKDKVLPIAEQVLPKEKAAEPVKLTTLPSGAVARDHRK